MGFFSKKYILIPNVAEKNILILVEEKNNNLIQSFCQIGRAHDKNSESDYYFFPPPKSEYFFQQLWESEYVF
jgi:hypothetical protein